MIITQKTIERLRRLINEETEYRSGPKLVAFFNQYGFNDSYGNGFPSRWFYTEEKIRALNGRPELDKCIKDVFAPVNFIGRFSELDAFLADFNQYLYFDGWKVIREGVEITFSKAASIDIEKEKGNEQKENNTTTDFLEDEFHEISIECLPIDSYVKPYIEARSNEKNHACQQNLLYP